MAERRLSTPVVLASASAMLALAAVVFLSTRDGAPDPPARPEPDALRIDDRTPERVAESFYDAWRRRRWDEALTISVGEANHAAREKRDRDGALAADERALVARMWASLAAAPLALALDEAEMLPEGRLTLRGTAEYTFVDRPYQRRVEFLIVPHGERYRVARMRLGEVLTELPPIFQGARDEDRP